MAMAAGGEHAAALTALLYVPLVLVAGAITTERQAAAGRPLAVRLQAAYLASGPTRRLLILLLAASAAIHAGLIGAHLAEDPVLAALFALDAAALGLAVVTAFVPGLRLWRAAVAVLLLANLMAYGAYLLAGVETVDAVGLLAKAIEVLGLGLVIHPAAGFVGTDGGRLRALDTKTQRRNPE